MPRPSLRRAPPSRPPQHLKPFSAYLIRIPSPPPLAIGRLEALRRGPRGSEARGRPAGRGAEDSHLGPTTIVHKHQIYDGVWAGRRASGSRCIMYYVDDAHVNSNSNEYGRLGVSSVFGGRDK